MFLLLTLKLKGLSLINFFCVYYESSSHQSHLQGKPTCSAALLSKCLLLVLYFTLKGSRVSAQVLILLMLPWWWASLNSLINASSTRSWHSAGTYIQVSVIRPRTPKQLQSVTRAYPSWIIFHTAPYCCSRNQPHDQPCSKNHLVIMTTTI